MTRLSSTKTIENVKFDIFPEDYRCFGIKAHSEQKYGGFPYAFHLSMVENVLVNFNYTDTCYRAAAWLHDTVEDTDTSIASISSLYGDEVADLVYAVTGEGKNRKERNASIYEKLKKYPKAIPLKVADRIANMRYGIANDSDKVSMYVDEFFVFSMNLRNEACSQRQSAIIWNGLEDIVSLAIRKAKEKDRSNNAPVA